MEEEQQHGPRSREILTLTTTTYLTDRGQTILTVSYSPEEKLSMEYSGVATQQYSTVALRYLFTSPTSLGESGIGSDAR